VLSEQHGENQRHAARYQPGSAPAVSVTPILGPSRISRAKPSIQNPTKQKTGCTNRAKMPFEIFSPSCSLHGRQRTVCGSSPELRDCRCACRRIHHDEQRRDRTDLPFDRLCILRSIRSSHWGATTITAPDRRCPEIHSRRLPAARCT
jgi:hypothetical protein